MPGTELPSTCRPVSKTPLSLSLSFPGESFAGSEPEKRVVPLRRVLEESKLRSPPRTMLGSLPLPVRLTRLLLFLPTTRSSFFPEFLRVLDESIAAKGVGEESPNGKRRGRDRTGTTRRDREKMGNLAFGLIAIQTRGGAPCYFRLKFPLHYRRELIRVWCAAARRFRDCARQSAGTGV